MLTVITVETYEHKYFKALTKSIRKFDSFSTYADVIYNAVDKLIGKGDFIESVEIVRFNPDIYGHTDLQQHNLANLVLQKGHAKGTMIKGCTVYDINE